MDRWLIAKFRQDGSLDTNFAQGAGYVAWLPLTTEGSTIAEDVVVDGKGRIIVYGYGREAGVWKVVVARFTAAGALDTTFGGGDGWLRIEELTGHTTGSDIATHGTSGGLSLGPGNDIFVTYSHCPEWDYYVARLNESGALETTFGDGGQLMFDNTAAESWDVHAEHVGGSLMVAAQHYTKPGGVFTGTRILRYDALTGAPNTSLDRDGRMDVSWEAYGFAAGLDGDILVSGQKAAADYDPHLLWLDGGSVEQWSPGVRDWDDGTSRFGACVESSTAPLAAGWTAGQCRAAEDLDPWRPIAADLVDPTAVVATASSGTTNAALTMRFGLRPAADQPPGQYLAPLDFEVVAP